MAEEKLVGKSNLDTLAKALDSRSKNRDAELQSAIDLRLVQPTEDGVGGQILSINESGDTAWIDNSKPISKEEIDAYLNEVFKDEVNVEGEIIDINEIKPITTTQIDSIMGSVFSQP